MTLAAAGASGVGLAIPEDVAAEANRLAEIRRRELAEESVEKEFWALKSVLGSAAASFGSDWSQGRMERYARGTDYFKEMVRDAAAAGKPRPTVADMPEGKVKIIAKLDPHRRLRLLLDPVELRRLSSSASQRRKRLRPSKNYDMTLMTLGQDVAMPEMGLECDPVKAVAVARVLVRTAADAESEAAEETLALLRDLPTRGWGADERAAPAAPAAAAAAEGAQPYTARWRRATAEDKARYAAVRCVAQWGALMKVRRDAESALPLAEARLETFRALASQAPLLE